MQIDPENMLLLEQHLACASAESYLQLHSDQQYFGPKIFKAADTLVNEGGLLMSSLQEKRFFKTMQTAMFILFG